MEGNNQLVLVQNTCFMLLTETNVCQGKQGCGLIWSRFTFLKHKYMHFLVKSEPWRMIRLQKIWIRFWEILLIHWSKQIDDSNCYDFKLLHPWFWLGDKKWLGSSSWSEAVFPSEYKYKTISEITFKIRNSHKHKKSSHNRKIYVQNCEYKATFWGIN